MLTESDPGAAAALWLLPLLLTAVLQAAHAAAIYLDDARLAADAAAGDRRAAVLSRLLQRNERVRLAVQITSYLCAALSSAGALALSAGAVRGARIALLLLLPILFYAVAVASPRRVAAYFPQRLAYALSGVLRLWCALCTPLVLCVSGVSALAVRLAGRDPAAAPSQVTEEEIRMLVDEGEESGAIDEAEKKMINSIFEFDDRDVTEVMTHRTELYAIPVTAALSEAVAVAMESGKTRLPVYEEDIDRICGILYAKDLLQFLGRPGDFSMREVVREPLYVPESASCADVFRLMQQKKMQLAIVVDEYGGTYGIVTMEDLLETIVGSIQDEYDDEQPEAQALGENVWVLDASMGLSQVEMLLDLRFPDESEADTLGGYLTEQLGYIPQGQEAPCVTVGDVRFTVERADDRRIDAVRAERIPPEAEN